MWNDRTAKNNSTYTSSQQLLTLQECVCACVCEWIVIIVKQNTKSSSVTRITCYPGFYINKLMTTHLILARLHSCQTDISHLLPIISHFWEALPTVCIGSELVTCCLATWMLATGTKKSFFQTLPVSVSLDKIKHYWQHEKKQVCFCFCLAIMVRQKLSSIPRIAAETRWDDSSNDVSHNSCSIFKILPACKRDRERKWILGHLHSRSMLYLISAARPEVNSYRRAER